MRTGVKQEVIRMTVAIKIRHTYQVKARGKSWAIRPPDMNIVVHIPYRCLACACIEKHIVREVIGVKVPCLYQFPHTGKRWAIGASSADRP